MTERRLIHFGSTWIAGLLSFAMMGYGLYSAMGVDIRFNPIPSVLYYTLPMASLPVFVLGFIWRRAALAQAVLAAAYATVSAILGWRQCSSLDYCTSVASVILVNLESKQVLIFFGAAMASCVAMIWREGRQIRGRTEADGSAVQPSK